MQAHEKTNLMGQTRSGRISLRCAAVGDAVAIAAVYAQAWGETYPGLLPQRVIDARMNFEEQSAKWRERLSESVSGRIVFVAEHRGVVDGFIHVAASDAATAKRIPGFANHVYALYVLKRAHEQGFGRALIRAAASELIARGSRSLSVDVLASNPARLFYEHLGAQFISSIIIRDGDDSWEQCAYGWPDVQAVL